MPVLGRSAAQVAVVALTATVTGCTAPAASYNCRKAGTGRTRARTRSTRWTASRSLAGNTRASASPSRCSAWASGLSA